MAQQIIDWLTEAILSWFVGFAENNPMIASFMVVMIFCRGIFKPTMTWIEFIVRQTKTEADDKVLAEVKSSKAYRIIEWLIDYTMSIKLNSVKKLPIMNK